MTVAAFFTWLLVPQIASGLVGWFGSRFADVRQFDSLVPQLLAAVSAPILLVLSLPLFRRSIEDGAQHCGAWAAMMLALLLPVVIAELVVAGGLQFVLGIIRDEF
jgi:hypothetical protein